MRLLRNRLTWFKNLPYKNTLMMVLRRTTKMRNIILNVFINIYTYSIYESIDLLILSNILYFCFTYSGYFWSWYSLNWKNLNLRNNFIISYIIFVCSFVWLYFMKSAPWWILVFYAMLGLGNGMYYFATVYFESNHLDKNVRDFYASTLKAWDELVKIVFPLLISGIFLLAKYMWRDGYAILLLFAVLPFLWAFLLILRLPDMHVSKIETPISFVTYLFPAWISPYKKMYYALFGVQRCLAIVFSVYLLWVLQTEINIWVYESILAVIWIWVLLLYSQKIDASNRSRILVIAFGGVALLVAWLGIFQDIWYLVFYSVLIIIFDSLARTINFAYYYDILDEFNKEANIQYDHQWIVVSDLYVNLLRVLFLIFLYALTFFLDTQQVVMCWFFLLAMCRVINIFVIRNVMRLI